MGKWHIESLARNLLLRSLDKGIEVVADDFCIQVVETAIIFGLYIW